MADISRIWIRKVAVGIAYPTVAIVATFVVTAICGGIISGLPRSEPNAPVTASWRVCIACTLLAQFVVPWLSSFAILSDARQHLAFLFCIALGVAINWYVFGGYYALEKAWRRGW